MVVLLWPHASPMALVVSFILNNVKRGSFEAVCRNTVLACKLLDGKEGIVTRISGWHGIIL